MSLNTSPNDVLARLQVVKDLLRQGIGRSTVLRGVDLHRDLCHLGFSRNIEYDLQFITRTLFRPSDIRLPITQQIFFRLLEVACNISEPSVPALVNAVRAHTMTITVSAAEQPCISFALVLLFRVYFAVHTVRKSNVESECRYWANTVLLGSMVDLWWPGNHVPSNVLMIPGTPEMATMISRLNTRVLPERKAVTRNLPRINADVPDLIPDDPVWELALIPLRTLNLSSPVQPAPVIMGGLTQAVYNIARALNASRFDSDTDLESDSDPEPDADSDQEFYTRCVS